jgi:hypothetical protein
MADTTTTNLLLTKPEVGASTDTWGTKINTDMGLIDDVFAAAGTGTSVGLNVGSGKTLKVAGSTDFSSNLTFTGTGNRITGDFSNATAASRVMFQTSTTNGIISVELLPNGTATTSQYNVTNNADPTNTSLGQFSALSTEVRLSSTARGTGTTLPMTFYTSGSERARIDTSGNVLINTTTSQTGAKLAVTGGIQGTITRATAVASTSGTSIDFTSIPSWVRRITVMFQGVSLSATANILVQLGTGGTPTYTTSGYLSLSAGIDTTSATTSATTGFNIKTDAAGQIFSGIMTIINITGNSWVASHAGKKSTTTVTTGGGDVTLGAVLTAVRITSTSTDTFDAGSVNLLYEG